MLSPCFLVLLSCLSIAVSSVIYGSLFIVDALLSLPPAVVLFFSGRRYFCVYCRFYLSLARIWTFYFTLATLANLAIPLDSVFLIHCIIITHISPSIVASLLVAVVSAVLPFYDLIMLLLTYPLLWCLEACYGSLGNKIKCIRPPKCEYIR